MESIRLFPNKYGTFIKAWGLLWTNPKMILFLILVKMRNYIWLIRRDGLKPSSSTLRIPLDGKVSWFGQLNNFIQRFENRTNQSITALLEKSQGVRQFKNNIKIINETTHKCSLGGTRVLFFLHGLKWIEKGWEPLIYNLKMWIMLFFTPIL